MRLLTIILICVCWSILLPAQYVVINVKGDVFSNNKLLQKKDKLNESAQLRFNSSDAHVYVMSPSKGYFILGVKEQKKDQGEFILALKDALLPPNEYHGAVTRTYDIKTLVFEDQYDMKGFFREQLFFIAPATFKVSAQNFPLDSTHYFIVRHHLADGWMEKRLPHANQAFEITPAILQLQDKVFNENSVQRSELLYVNEESVERQSVGNFKVQFLKEQSIKEELKTLYDAVKPITADKFLLEHALPYLNALYGKTSIDVIRDLIQRF